MDRALFIHAPARQLSRQAMTMSFMHMGFSRWEVFLLFLSLGVNKRVVYVHCCEQDVFPLFWDTC